MSRLLLFAGLVISMFYPLQSRAQGDQTKIAINITPDKTTGAWLHLPDDYNSTSTNYPLIIFLHGAGEGGTDLNVVLAHGLPKIIAQGAKMEFTVNGKLFKFITVSPQIPNGWASEDMVQNILNDIKSKYRVDVSRVYLTGLSAGGYGVLNYVASGFDFSSKLAAIVPVSTAAIDNSKVDGLCNIAGSNIASWFLCGSLDGFIDNQVNYVNKINTCSPTYPAIATSYPGGTHSDNVWDKAYDATHTYQSPNIYEWMLQYTDTAREIPPPIAAVAAGNITITLPVDSIVLDGSPSTAPGSRIISYDWKLVSGHLGPILSSTNNAIITVTKLISGRYTFNLTVKNTVGMISTKQVTVVVNPIGGAAGSTCDFCKFLITPGVDGGAYINGVNLHVQPGDTVCIQAGNYSYIQFFNFTGSAVKPIVFVNCGGPVNIGNGGNYGFIFNNTKYFKVTGSGSSDKYGFIINGVGKRLNVGLAMGKRCTDYEAERVEITGSEVGVMAKVNPDCDTANQYPYFAIRNVKLHDIYIHDVSGEGMYIGNTAPNGTTVTCTDGTVKNVLPPRIYGLRIYNINVANTGWDAIQVASAPEDVEIYNNSVSNFGVMNVGSQQAGIILGGETNGKVYNNTVIKGTGNGIEVFGIGLCSVYNNIISDAGFDSTTTKQDALFIDDRPTKNNYIPLHVNVFNNTIVNSGRDAIRYMNSYGTVAPGNLFYNNLMANVGSKYLNIVTGIDYTASNNLSYADITVVKFSNAGAKDFHLASGSPAIDKGLNLSAYFNTDIDGDIRPWGITYDVGADEYESDTIINKPPIAVAGADTTIVFPVSSITLDGSGSSDPDGSIVSYAWTQISGPVTATIGSATTSKPAISGLTTIGTYGFKLIVTDNAGDTASDQVNVILIADTSELVANAGPDKTIRQPKNSSNVSGAGSTDSNGTITGYNWTQVSGPTIATIVSPNKVKTDLNRLTSVGTYIFRLTVTNNKGMKATDDVSIFVIPNPAHGLFANAGTDQTIAYPSVNKVTLDGSASYATNHGYISYYAWTKVSGPDGYSILNASSPVTVVTFTATGTYVFRLKVTDTYNNTATDDVTIIVSNTNASELVANAGADKTITQPMNSSDVSGAGSTDSDGTITGYNWTQVSGPTTATIVSPTGVKTDLNRLTSVGTYIFRLTVTNNKGMKATDDVSIFVIPNPANELFANAGIDQTIAYPSVNKVTLDGSASYATNHGYISYYAWTKVSGPDGYSILNASSPVTVVTFTATGTYVFRLKVTDTYNNTATDDVTIIVGNTGPGTAVKMSSKKLDVAMMNASDIRIYPNPVVSILHLNLRLNAAATVVVRIYNSNGEIKGTYYLGTITSIQKDIDVNNLASGMYILQIKNDSNPDLYYKFIKSD